MITKAITIRMENELIDNNHNAFNQSLSLYNLGLIYFDRQNYDQTIEQLLKAVDSFNRIDNPSLHYLHHKKQLFRWLGRAHYKKFEREKAIEYFTQQIAVLTLLLPSYPNYIGEIAETEWFIGSKYCELAMVNEAFDYFKYCVAHVRIMHKAGLISSYKYLEQYLLDIADTLVYRSRLDLAKEFLEEACEIIGEQDNPDQFSWLQSRVNRLMEAVLQRL